jgi:hypothetical protein
MNLKKLKKVAQLLLVVCIMALASCSKKDKTEYFMISPESMDIQPKAKVDEDIPVYLYGSIGPNYCYKLDGIRFPYMKSDSEEGVYFVGVEIWVAKENKDFCEGTELRLEDKEFSINFEFPGTYIFFDYNKNDVELGKIEVFE